MGKRPGQMWNQSTGGKEMDSEYDSFLKVGFVYSFTIYLCSRFVPPGHGLGSEEGQDGGGSVRATHGRSRSEGTRWQPGTQGRWEAGVVHMLICTSCNEIMQKIVIF